LKNRWSAQFATNFSKAQYLLILVFISFVEIALKGGRRRKTYAQHVEEKLKVSNNKME